MDIVPTLVGESGPGIDLSGQPDSIAIQMSDPVRDLECALNRVPFVFDLSRWEHVRLAFETLEYGDEPHASPRDASQ